MVLLVVVRDLELVVEYDMFAEIEPLLFLTRR